MAILGMSEELPKRLFKPGEETEVHQINNNCKMVRYFKRLMEWLPKELETVKKDPVFAQIFKLFDNGLGFSARVIHGFLCRELLTYKDHELWFVFARRPLRFSLLEFHAVTGLQCDTSLSLKELVDWDDDGGFWSLVIRTNKGISIFELWEHHRAAVKKWSNADRIRLVYLCIIVCMVCGRDEKAPIPIKYVKLVMDLEQVRNYPWGVASFDLLCESIAEKRDKLKENPKSYVLDGFTYGLQIWAMEAIPKLGKLCGRKLNKSFKNGPRCVNWMGAAKISYEELNKLENILTPKDDIYPYISWTGNYTVCESLQFSRRDEVEDDRVKLLMQMIMKQFDFSGHNWEYEETPVFSFGVDNKEGEKEKVATHEGEGGSDEEPNDKDGEGGSDEAAGSNEASGSDEEFQTPKGSATIRAKDTKGKKRLPDRGMEKKEA
uniref:DUF1985 domain-containing protein n=1 Tax=Brassica oleracea var. oleracea TaxID=109376 RepID=A0A0D3BFQ6_BRAOL